MIADTFAHALSLCGIHIIPAYRHNEMISASGLASERDTTLILSFSETLPGEFNREIRRLHQAGCHIISISSSKGDIIGDLIIRVGNGGQDRAASSALANRVILDFILSWIARLIAAEKEWQNNNTAE